MAKIDIDSLPGNSHIEREKKDVGSKNTEVSSVVRKKIDPVISSSSLAKSKPSVGDKLKKTFFQEDMSQIKKWLMEDVIVPGIKRLVLDSISMAFFHETYSRGNKSYPGSVTNYTSYYKSDNNRQQTKRGDSRRYEDDHNKIDYRNIVCNNRNDAEKIVNIMYDAIEEYGRVSIGDLYSYVDITPSPTDFNWGWDDVRDIGVKPVYNGFLIDVRDAKLLD